MKPIYVTQSTMPPFEEYIEEIKDIWDSHILTNMGPKHKALEKELEKLLEVNNLALFTNGHNALEMLIDAYGFPKGSEVITSPFTFASTTHAIIRNGLNPVFCDINEDDYTIDVDKIESLITDKTVAIVPIHVYGNICDVDRLQEIAAKYNLKLIYDAAHVFGVKYKNKGIGSYGNASMFSTHATKAFNTIEGGIVTCDEMEIIEKLNDLKNFGIRGPERVVSVGGNAKLNEFCAAMGLCNLRHFEDSIKKRGLVFERYQANLRGVKGIRLVQPRKESTKNYAYYPVRFEKGLFGKDRDEVYKILNENEIYPRKYFYPITNTFECYKDRFDPNSTPIALRVSHEILTLPMYENLDLQDVDRICRIILS